MIVYYSSKYGIQYITSISCYTNTGNTLCIAPDDLSIYGRYPSYLIIIHNSNCDNRTILHLLSVSIVAIRICLIIHPSIHPYSCLPPLRQHWCFCFPLRTTLAPNCRIGIMMSVLRRAIFAPSMNLPGPLP